MKGIVAILHVRAFGHYALDHRQIAGKGSTMKNSAIVNAGHVPVALFFQKEIDRLTLPTDVAEEECQPNRVAGAHGLSATI